MANYIATSEELTAVADAIRAKGGTTDSMVFPEGFVSAIADIQVGGGGAPGRTECVVQISGISVCTEAVEYVN